MARMVDDMYQSAATKSDYIHWVMKDKLGFNDKDCRKYRRLMAVLSSIEFVWIHPMDENRAIDGLELRSDFTDETELYLDGRSGLPVKCSVFEMMAALAIRVENRIMRNLSVGDRTGVWFMDMLRNLGLDRLSDDVWGPTDEEFVLDVVHDMLYRDYKSNGEGGLFPLKGRNRGKNQRNEQIWNQCMAYLSENYGNDDPDLALFS